MTKRSIGWVATLLAVLAWPAPAVAQDAHYWTYGYGPVGQLTEGTIVGGVSDLSAVFYNPGALALLDQPRFVIGLNSVEFANIEVPGVAGEKLDVDQLVFDVVPSMIAGSVGSHDGANHFAFAFLSRHDTDWDLAYSDASVSALTPEGSAGFGRVRQRLVEYWLGGTWSHRFSDRFSVGMSPFFAYRAQRSRRSLTLEEVTVDSSRSVFVGRENEYNHLRALAKLGVAWRPKSWELGLTVTTPSLALASQGKSAFNASVSGGASGPLLAASTQKGLDATYRAPWSIAAGATWRLPRTAIHSTVEWFSSVAAYDILQPEPAPIAGRPETISLTYRGEAASTFCYGIGLEHRLGERTVFYGGAAHNESAHVPDRDTFAAWDLTDVTGGLTFDTARARLALGLGYAWGKKEIAPAILPPDQTGAAALAEARISRWTISVGASFNGRGRR